MGNKVFLNDHGIIEVVYTGDQTHETVTGVTSQVLALATRLQEAGKKVCILNSLSKLGRSTAGARKAASAALGLRVYSRVALYGANLFMKYVASLIIMASGQSKKVKYFNTRSEAEQWLMHNID